MRIHIELIRFLSVAFFLLATSSTYACEDETSERLLIQSVRAGDLDTIEALIADGVDINAAPKSGGYYGETALHVAAFRKHVDVLRLLIDSGANVDAADESGLTALHHSALHGPIEAVRALIAAGADLDADRQIIGGGIPRGTPLLGAAWKGNIEIVRALIDAGADLNGVRSEYPLTAATRNKKLPMMRLLIDSGADVNTIKDPALHWAQEAQHARLLIDSGASVNARNAQGQTALHLPHVYYLPSTEVIDVLITAGGDIDAESKKGVTPLLRAIGLQRLEITQRLIAAGADVNVRDMEGYTALSLAQLAGEAFVDAVNQGGGTRTGQEELFAAVRAGDFQTVQRLVEIGENIDAMGPGKATVVHLASRFGHHEILRLLVEENAQVDARDQRMLRPLHFAKDAAIAATLIEAGAVIDPALFDDEPMSPLMAAVCDGRAGTAGFLIDHGAAVNPLDASGFGDSAVAPLTWAAFFGRVELIELLLENGARTEQRGDSGGESALLVSARGGLADMSCPNFVTSEIRRQIANLLIEHGADVNVQANVGVHSSLTPLYSAARNGDLEIVKLLLENGAEIEAAPKRGGFAGATALHGAVEANEIEVVQYLLESGAHINPTTRIDGMAPYRTPLDKASTNEMRQLLIGRGAKRFGEEP